MVQVINTPGVAMEKNVRLRLLQDAEQQGLPVHQIAVETVKRTLSEGILQVSL